MRKGDYIYDEAAGEYAVVLDGRTGRVEYLNGRKGVLPTGWGRRATRNEIEAAMRRRDACRVVGKRVTLNEDVRVFKHEFPKGAQVIVRGERLDREKTGTLILCDAPLRLGGHARIAVPIDHLIESPSQEVANKQWLRSEEMSTPKEYLEYTSMPKKSVHAGKGTKRPLPEEFELGDEEPGMLMSLSREIKNHLSGQIWRHWPETSTDFDADQCKPDIGMIVTFWSRSTLSDRLYYRCPDGLVFSLDHTGLNADDWAPGTPADYADECARFVTKLAGLRPGSEFRLDRSDPRVWNHALLDATFRVIAEPRPYAKEDALRTLDETLRGASDGGDMIQPQYVGFSLGQHEPPDEQWPWMVLAKQKDTNDLFAVRVLATCPSEMANE